MKLGKEKKKKNQRARKGARPGNKAKSKTEHSNRTPATHEEPGKKRGCGGVMRFVGLTYKKGGKGGRVRTETYEGCFKEKDPLRSNWLNEHREGYKKGGERQVLKGGERTRREGRSSMK